ncbi:M23 family metallopeptidase [Desulfosarcina sp.]|uniref:M23 family metallopeptidase n=1 Tax=Desulfosarcina sp. TaxID=2027861 RepID=UPI003970A2E3
MNKKLTLLIFDAAGSPVRQTTVPRMFLPVTVLLCLTAALVICFCIFDYIRLKGEVQAVHTLRSKLRTQAEQVAQQQSQIVAFSNKINEISTELVNLQNFEHKIRIIANLETSDSGSSLFGVGGSDPEDLDPAMMMEKDYQDLVRDMHVEINEIDHAAHNQHDSFASIFSHLEGKRNLLAATPSVRPVKGWISSHFGYRESPFTGRREFHRGLDIATHAGTPIISPADGIVTFAGSKGLMGNMITIEHGFGMVTRYGHTQKIVKKRGEQVKRGETIALVGNTGRSTGPHVHYEVRLNGVAVNPTNYFFN